MVNLITNLFFKSLYSIKTKLTRFKEDGFTLTELVVTLFIMTAIMAATFASFMTLSKSFKGVSKMTETHMEDIAGLDILRYDTEMGGYGLPKAYFPPSLGINYTEAASDGTYSPDPASLNDAPANEPRPYAFSDNSGGNNSDVLTIKSLAVALTNVSEKWTFLYYNGATWVYRSWNDTRYDFKNTERVIFVSPINKTIQVAGGNWYFNIVNWPNHDIVNMPTPGSIDLAFIMYGVDSTSNLRMPFNRVDYFLYRPSSNFPTRCNPNTYTLYRAVISHTNGLRNQQPLLDCVADFQVAFGLDTNADNIIDTWTGSALPTSVSTQIDWLKEIKVFVLAQEGQFDPDFTYASATITVGDNDIMLKNFDLTTLPNYANYRWKLYKMVAKPLNLM